MSDQQPIPETDTATIPHWYSPDSHPITIADAEGSTVYDDAGNGYLDFMSQLYCVNAGHDNQAIIDAITEQLQDVPYVSSAKHNDARERLADRLGEIAPGDLDDVYFAISGSEANESAIQFAREIQDAPKVLTRWQSYHGGTYGAAGLTGDPSTRANVERYSATTGTAKFLPPISYRSPFDADTPEELAEQAADHLEFVIRNEGPDSVAAVLTEPIAGTSGAYTAPPGYFERVREICDEYDVLLISDEVITGFGRCGEWFGIDTEGVQPDMITFAKGVTSAYVPLAGVIASPEIGDQLREDGVPVGQTFAGHPAGCAAGLAAIEEYENGLIEQGRSVAPHLEDRLREIEDRHEEVGTIRGRGLHWSVVFTDPETGEPFLHPWAEEGDNPVKDVIAAAEERGALFGSGRPTTQLLVSPPLCVTESEIDRAMDALDGAIESVFS